MKDITIPITLLNEVSNLSKVESGVEDNDTTLVHHRSVHGDINNADAAGNARECHYVNH